MKKRIGKGLGKKAIAGAISASMVIGAVMTNPVPAMAGDTLPYLGESKRGENQPYQHGYRAEDLLSWSPASDPYAELLRARVPLQKRNEAFTATQANPSLSSAPQYFTLTGDYGNAFFDSYPYTNEYSQHLFNFWQYVDYYGSWHGMPTEDVPESLYNAEGERNGTSNWEKRSFEFGILNLPNPAYTNAAHRNGVLSIGCIMQPRAFQHFDALLVQDADGNFPCADKLVEICNYYGFDGWFFNMEGRSISSEQQELLGKFFAQMRRAGLYIQWYTASSSFSTSSTAPYLTSATVGNTENPELRAQSVFLDYGWSGSTAANNARSVGLDPYESVFGGIEAGGNRWSNNYDRFLDGNGNMVMSIASLGTDFVQTGFYENTMQREEDEYQWIAYDRERMWWTGPSFDPTVTQTVSEAGRSGIDADRGSMKGVSHYIAERSAINGDVFETSFNTGHGIEYRINGEVSSDKEWSNINVQDYLPTWQWWITSQSGNEIGADFDYGPNLNYKNTDGSEHPTAFTKVGGFEGPDSLVLYGKVDSENYLRLYKTDLQVDAASAMDVTFKKTSEDEVALKLALVFKDAPEDVVKIDLPQSKEKGEWTTASADLSAYAGRSIASLGLVVDGQADAYQINVGKIRLSNGSQSAPAAPTNVTVKNAFDTGEMIVTWDIAPYDQVQNYNVYANKNGKRVWLGGNYDSIFYIKNTDGLASEEGSAVTGLKISPEEIEAQAGSDVAFSVEKLSEEIQAGAVTIEVCAVGNGGLESVPASASHNFLSAPTNVQVYAADGNLNVTWDGGQGDVTVTTSCEDSPRTWTASGDGSATVAVASGKEADGARYILTISTAGGFTNYQGRLNDCYSAPYDGRVDPERRVFTGPSSKDWYQMHYWYLTLADDGSYQYGDEQIYTRGKKTPGATTNDWAFFSTIPDDVDKIAVVLEDYSGNMSEEVIIGNRTLIRIEASETKIAASGQVQFTATVVNGSEDEEDNKVVWSVSGANDTENTVIDENGLLTVGEKETAPYVTVKAALEKDSRVSAEENVEIVPLYTLESDSQSAYKGDSIEFYVKNNVTMEKFDASAYSWSVEGAKNGYWGNVSPIAEGTKVENGVLTVAAAEPNSRLKVTAEDSDGVKYEKTVGVEDLYGMTPEGSYIDLLRGSKTQFAVINKKTREATDPSLYTWELKAAWGAFTSEQTKLTDTGILYIGKDETAYYGYVYAKNKETGVTYQATIYLDIWSDPVDEFGSDDANKEASAEGSSESSSESSSEASSENSSESSSESSSEGSSDEAIEPATGSSEEKADESGDESSAGAATTVEEEGQETVVETETNYAENSGDAEGGIVEAKDQEYIWTVSGATDEETAISEDGVLHIGKNEEGKLTVTVTYAENKLLSATATVNVKKTDSEEEQKGSFVTKWGSVYYVLEDGTKLTGLQTIDGETYYFNARGVMAKQSFVTTEDGKRYFDNNGHMVKGLFTKWGSEYYFDENGLQVSDKMVDHNGYTYYLNAKGHVVKSSFVDFEDGTRYFDGEGHLVKGRTFTKWMRKYTADENGIIVK